MLQILLVVVAVALAVLVVVVATRPSAFHVERKLEIAAPRERVFAVLGDLRQFASVLVLFGKPWEEADPKMKKTFDGPAAGAGQSFAWSGNMQVGKGTMTIEETVLPEKVRIRLQFEKPMKSTGAWILAIDRAPAGSLVTWSMDGNHNFLGKAFGLFMNMDEALRSDLDKGLARLKTLAERT